MQRSVLEKALVGVELLLALGSFYGGWALLSDPTGNSLEMPAAMFLMGSPFDSYLIPGLILFVVNGAFPLLVIVGTLMRMPWAIYGHVTIGGLLTGWMVVQIALIGLNTSIQGVFLVLGLLITGLGVAAFKSRKAAAGGDGPAPAN